MKIINIFLVFFVLSCNAEENDADLHNNYRIGLNSGKLNTITPNPPIKLLVYDENLAQVAQSWSDQCVWKHSTNGYGENLFVSSYPNVSVSDALESWVEEVDVYDYSNGTCSGVCGHYTQVVSNRSTKVGCGKTTCPTIEGLSWSGTIITCNYSPHGNFNGMKPYEVNNEIEFDTYEDPIAKLDGILYEGNVYSSDLIFENGILTPFNIKSSSKSPKNYLENNILYIPNILVGETFYYLLLENDNFSFTIKDIGETNNVVE